MNNQIVAANLLRLRNVKGLTQDGLATAADLSRGAYRNLEKGRSAPRTSTLKALSIALDVSLKELLSPVTILENVRFRSLKRLKTRGQVLVDVNRWLRDFSDLEDLVGEKVVHNLLPLWKKINRQNNRNIPEIAAYVREHFGLNEREPVHDICGLLESQGIKVSSIQVATDAFLGLSVSVNDGGPAVIINTWERLPVETWIFSAAHELGHLLMHLSAYDVSKENEEKEQEKEADQFSSHFLMPNDVFFKEWNDAAGLPLFDRVLKVKRVFRVSWRTVVYRVSEGIEENKRYLLWRYFNDEYRKRKGRSLLKHDEPDSINKEVYHDAYITRHVGVEPAPMEAHDFREDRLSLLVRKGIEKEVITISRGAEILHEPLEQMRELVATWSA